MSVTDETRREAAQHFWEGQRAYELGNYDQAIPAFETAWELSEEPTMLFNLGQAYWKRFEIDAKVEDLRKARRMFSNYDAKMQGQEGYDRRQIEGYLAALEVQIDAAEEAEALRAQGLAVEGPSPEEIRLERRRKTTKSLHRSGTAFIVIGSVVGLAAVGALIGRGATGFMLDQAGGGEAGKANQNTADEDRDLRQSYSISGKVAFGSAIGTAFLLPLGITLKVSARVRDKEDTRLYDAMERRRELREQRLAIEPGSSLFRLEF